MKNKNNLNLKLIFYKIHVNFIARTILVRVVKMLLYIPIVRQSGFLSPDGKFVMKIGGHG